VPLYDDLEDLEGGVIDDADEVFVLSFFSDGRQSSHIRPMQAQVDVHGS